MYEHYWGLTSAPFANRLGERSIYESPVHEEALARLLYCIEEHKALAILHGPAGCGKSQLLSIVAGQVRRTQRYFALVNSAEVCDREFLNHLDRELRLGGVESDSVSLRWRRLRDFFGSTQEAGLQTVLALDGLEHAEESVLGTINRLVSLHNQSLADLTIVASFNHGDVSSRLKELLELADMVIEVKSFERPETESYIHNRLESSGGQKTVFQTDAIDQLQQITRGVPREINRLCELALLAGMSDSLTAIDRKLIASLAAENQRP